METLNVVDHGAIRVIELDRPEALNALNAQMIDDLADTFIEATTLDSVKTVILTGAGRAFWAGADLKEMGQRKYQPRHTFTEVLHAIIDFPKPFFVAVNGIGVGIGATICGLADFVYMAQGARLRCPFSSLGLTAEAASTVTFPRLLGHQQASWLLLAGEWMDADKCLAAGLAMEVLPPDQLMPTVMERADTLASLPAASLQMTKSLIRANHRDELKAAVAAENRGLAELSGGPANKEALAAFREKRKPEFSEL